MFLTPERLDKATRFFDRHGGKIIIVAGFIEGLRQANGIIAGTSGMRWARFLTFNAIGAALWVLVWTSIGYLSGSRIDTIYPDATRYSTYLAIAVGRSWSPTSRDAWCKFAELGPPVPPEAKRSPRQALPPVST